MNNVKFLTIAIALVAAFGCKKSHKTDESGKQNVIDSMATSMPTAEMITDVAKKQQSTFQPTELNTVLETQRICAGQMPAGWLKISGQWDPTSCGKPTSIHENVWYIERYDNKPVGSVMTVCAQPIPNGWVKIGGSWNPTMCGSPSSIHDNVIQIKRLN